MYWFEHIYMGKKQQPLKAQIVLCQITAKHAISKGEKTQMAGSERRRRVKKRRQLWSPLFRQDGASSLAQAEVFV